MDSVGEGEGGKIWENGIETCKISCIYIKEITDDNLLCSTQSLLDQTGVISRGRASPSTWLLLTSEENAVPVEMTRAVSHSEIFIQGK